MITVPESPEFHFSFDTDMLSGSFLFSVHFFSMYILVDIPGWQCCTNFHARVQLGLFPSCAAKICQIPESSSRLWWNSCPHKKKHQKAARFFGAPGTSTTGLMRVYRCKMEGDEGPEFAEQLDAVSPQCIGSCHDPYNPWKNGIFAN